MFNKLITELFNGSNTRDGITPNSSANAKAGNRISCSLIVRSLRDTAHSSPPFNLVSPKNIRCKVQRKYAADNRIPREPKIAIQRGMPVPTLSALNVPMITNASPMKAENPGSLKEAKNAIATSAVYLGLMFARHQKL